MRLNTGFDIWTVTNEKELSVYGSISEEFVSHNRQNVSNRGEGCSIQRILLQVKKCKVLGKMYILELMLMLGIWLDFAISNQTLKYWFQYFVNCYFPPLSHGDIHSQGL